MTPLSIEVLRELAPGYVMGTLTPDELRNFTTALADPKLAAELQPEIEAHQAAAEFLATSVSANPPAALRDRVMSRIAAEPQATHSTNNVASEAVLFPRRGPSRWVTGGLITALAASAIFAVSLRQQIGELRASLTDTQSALATTQEQLQARERTVRILTEGGNDMVTVRLAANENTGPSMQVFWNVRAGTAVVRADGLRSVPADRIYQLWMIRDSKPVSVALFRPNADGTQLTEVSVPTSVQGIAAFAVTEEPAAGSAQPTMTPFLVGAVGAN